MLDLSLQKQNTLEIKWVDGKVIKLLPPAQKFFKQLQELEGLDNSDYVNMLDVIYDTVCVILNKNANKITFSLDTIEDSLTLDSCMAIIREYINFFTSELNKISFQ